MPFWHTPITYYFFTIHYSLFTLHFPLFTIHSPLPTFHSFFNIKGRGSAFKQSLAFAVFVFYDCNSIHIAGTTPSFAVVTLSAALTKPLP